MFKKLTIYITAALLAMAVLTPLVIDLFELTENINLLSEFELGEEDQKEAKKELEIKDLFFTKKSPTENLCIADLQSKITDYYLVKASLFHSEVISPPPRPIS